MATVLAGALVKCCHWFISRSCLNLHEVGSLIDTPGNRGSKFSKINRTNWYFIPKFAIWPKILEIKKSSMTQVFALTLVKSQRLPPTSLYNALL